MKETLQELIMLTSTSNQNNILIAKSNQASVFHFYEVLKIIVVKVKKTNKQQYVSTIYIYIFIYTSHRVYT